MNEISLGTPIDPHAGARRRFEMHRRRIHAVAGVLTLNREVAASDVEIAQMVGMSDDRVAATRRLMLDMGVLKYRREPNGRARGGYIGMWTLLKDDAELFHAIDLEMERQMRGGLSSETQRRKAPKKTRRLTRQSQERVAVQEDRLGFAVGAVAGPEPISPLRTSLKGSGPDAPAALVMAAKQYRHGRGDERVRKAQALVKELNDLGVSVPADLAEAATVKKDSRLEAVALVLPYIEDLERRLVVAQDQLRAQADYGTLKQINDRQKHQIERLVAERTQAALGERPQRA